MSEQVIDEPRVAQPSAPPAEVPVPRASALLPSTADLLFVLLAVTIPVAAAAKLLSSDGDLARHLRLGEWMLANRAILRFDNFSFTRTGDPFLPFEWGSGVAYAFAHRLGGLSAVAILAALLIALTIALLIVFQRGRGVDPSLALLVGLAAAANSAVHWLARPHLFTFVGTVLLLFLLERTGERRLWPFVPLFVIWANFHGGFFFGLVLIGIYLAGSVAERMAGSDRETWGANVRYYGAALGLATAACLVNPFGWRLLVHVTDFVGGQSFIKRFTQEFQSPSFHELEPRVFLLTLLVAVAALAICRERPTYPRLFAFLATAAFALVYQRNIALFGIVALPLLALHLDPYWRSLRVPGLARIRRVVAETDGNGRLGAWTGIAAMALVLLGLGGGSVAGARLVADRFDPERFPVELVERARAAGVEGRIFNEFIWGGYLLYAWPEQRVFIDGGTDFYGADLMRGYMEVRELRPGWRDALARWDISLVLVPPASAIAHELERDAGWYVWDCDATGVLLRRAAPGAPLPAGGGRTGCLVGDDGSVLGRLHF